MGTTNSDGSLKDSTPDSFCEAIVVNSITKRQIRFRTIRAAKKYADNHPNTFYVIIK